MAPPAYDLKLANQEGKELEKTTDAASEVNVSTDDSQDPQITLAWLRLSNSLKMSFSLTGSDCDGEMSCWICKTF